MRVKRRRGDEEKAELAGPIGYRVPIGESGASRPPSARKSNSIIQVYAFERQHTAFQRLAAKRHGQDFSVTGQRVTIHTAISSDGRVIATGGETTTVLEDAAGRTTLLKELAFVSDVRRAFLAQSAIFFGQGRRILPQFAVFDAFASRLRVEQARREVLEANRDGILQALRELQGPVADSRRFEIPRLEESLTSLLSRLREIQDDALFEGRRVRVGDGDLLSASPLPSGAFAEGLETSAVSVLELASGASIVSDPVGNGAAALDLLGEFSINGVVILIQETDGLGAIMRRINFGEDVNEDGRLNNAEDRNFSRTLNHGEDANGNGVLDTAEDEDGDGVLDTGEDLNYNGRLDISEDRDFDFTLDGGVSRLGIRARLEGNRLVITAPAADVTLEFEDPDGILQEIGLLTRDANLELVPKTLLVASRDAAFTVDGQEKKSPSNTVDGAIPSVRLTLLGEGKSTVTVDRFFDPLVDQISRFIDQYNKTLGLLNGFLVRGGIFDEEPTVSRIRQEIGSEVEDNPQLTAVGVQAERDPKRLTIHELQLEVLVTHLRQGLSRVFDRIAAPRTPANSLESIGIVDEADGLVHFDADLFRKALTRERAGVRDLLIGPEGALTRVAKILELSTDRQTGRLRFLGDRLKDDPVSEREFTELVEEILAKHLRASAIGSFTDQLG